MSKSKRERKYKTSKRKKKTPFTDDKLLKTLQKTEIGVCSTLTKLGHVWPGKLF